MSGGRVLGVDACRAGWVGIALAGGGARAYFAPGIAGTGRPGHRGRPGAGHRHRHSHRPGGYRAAPCGPAGPGGARPPVAVPVHHAGPRRGGGGRLSGRRGREPAAGRGRPLAPGVRPAGQDPRRRPVAPGGEPGAGPGRGGPPGAELRRDGWGAPPVTQNHLGRGGPAPDPARPGGHCPGRRPRAGRGAGRRRRRARRGRGGLDRPAGQPGLRALPAPAPEVFSDGIPAAIWT